MDLRLVIMRQDVRGLLVLVLARTSSAHWLHNGRAELLWFWLSAVSIFTLPACHLEARTPCLGDASKEVAFIGALTNTDFALFHGTLFPAVAQGD